MSVIASLKAISAELFDLQNISAVLGWDQEVYMPPGASADRASQLSYLAGLIHSKQTSAELGALLQKSQSELSSYTTEEQSLVRVMQRAYDQSTKLPLAFVQDFSRLTSESMQAWVQARRDSDFSQFSPYLEKIVEMTRRQTEYLGYSEHPYDSLLDLYEEGLTTSDVEKVFLEIKSPLVSLVSEISHSGRWNEDIAPHLPIPVSEQIAFVTSLSKAIGYDFERGRIDSAPHPFMTRLGHSDRRITNRYSETDISGALFGALHESGHALYELGISDSLARTDLDNGVSLGMHESQSRMWENMIGRSKAFWEGYYPRLQAAFPSQFETMPLDEFYVRINHVEPSLIRTESDEVTYNLHILIRFEIEKALVEGSVLVKDVGELWNAKYKEYLGVDVPDDAHGVLQDIHWSHGTLGYFPTYTLGNLAAAQIWHTYTQFDPLYEHTLRNGEFSKIRVWLTEHMYQYGSVYQPKDLMRRITGEETQSSYLVQYLKEKYL